MENVKDPQTIQAIFDNAPDAVIVIDDSGHVLNWNSRAEAIFGWKESEVLGQFLHEFIIPERYREAHVRGLEHFKHTGQGKVLYHTIEIEGLRRDGSEVAVSLSISPALVKGKQLFTGFVRDISEKKSQELQLHSTEERLRLLVDSVREYAIIMLEPDGMVASWNAGAQRLTQYTVEEIIGKHFSTFYTDEDRDRNHPVFELKKAIEEGRYEEEGWRICKDGSRYWANVIITPVYDKHRVFRGFAKVTRDMTEQMQAARVLEESNRELERSNEELSAFSYAASHDLKEPLRKIQTFISRIMDKDADNLSPASRDAFNRVTSAADRMQNLIDDLLTYSQVSNAPNEEVRAVNLNDVFDEIKKVHKNLYDDKQLIIETGALPIVHASPLQMRQLFENLISNAIKYAKPDVPSRVIITANDVASPNINDGLNGVRYSRINIKDNGIGFDQKFAARIFNMFERLHGKNEYPGTGIGLAIAKRIVENHQGFIEAHGVPGEGATFSVFFPKV